MHINIYVSAACDMRQSDKIICRALLPPYILLSVSSFVLITNAVSKNQQKHKSFVGILRFQSRISDCHRYA